MKLYSSNTSPYGRKVRIVLAEKGLSYEQDPTGAQVKSVEEMAALNPALKIPILEDRGVVLFDSDLIIDYLCRTYRQAPAMSSPPPLAASPHRPDHAWEDGKLLATVRTLLDTAVNLRQLVLSGVPVEQSSYLQRHEIRIQYCLDYLEQRATTEGFFPGFFSFADIHLICALDFGDHREVFPWREGRPTLQRLRAYFGERPSLVDTHPARE